MIKKGDQFDRIIYRVQKIAIQPPGEMLRGLLIDVSDQAVFGFREPMA